MQQSMTDSDVLQKDQDRHLRSVSQEDIGSLAMELLREALPAISAEANECVPSVLGSNMPDRSIKPTMGVHHTDTNRIMERYITDLIVECTSNDINHPALDTIGLVIFGLGDEAGTRVKLERESPETWRQSYVVKLLTEINELLIVATSEETTDFAYVSLENVDELALESETSTEYHIKAFKSFEGAPSLKLKLQVADLSANKVRVEIGNDDLWQNVLSRESLDATWESVSSALDEEEIFKILGERAEMLDIYGSVLSRRFERSGVLTDISNAILAYRRAVELHPDGHSDMSIWQNNLGNSLFSRFQRTGDRTDLASAISAYQRAVDLTSGDHPNLRNLQNNLAMSLLHRSEYTQNLQDITDTIAALQRAVLLNPDADADMPKWQYSLGNSFLSRFQRVGELNDIDNAISSHQTAIQLTPDGHADMPHFQSGLGNSFLFRFERTGDLSDIVDAISSHQMAVQLASDEVALPGWLSNLGNSFTHRFNRTGDLTDIANAISAHQRAIKLAPHDHASMAKWQNNLGNSLADRFKRTGDLADIDNAISAHERAAQLTPDSHAAMPIQQSNLGNSLASRFERTGDLTDIAKAISAHERAVQLTPDGHADMPSLQASLGNSFARRFQQTGDLADIANAISAHQRAVQLTPDDHAYMPIWQSNLGLSILRLFERTGNLTDLAKAISAHQRAIQLAPDGHVDMPIWLNGLGYSFMRHFEYSGDLADIANAISSLQRAIRLAPNGHADLASWQNNLGNSFLCRFERTGDIPDIVNAISAHQVAVLLTPDGHADMPRRRNNLGNSFALRFDRTGELTDNANAISTYQRAIQLLPDGHAVMPTLQSNLGHSFLRRFSRTADPPDVTNAILAHQKAISLTPDNHAHMPSWQNKLGNSFLARFIHSGDFADITKALSAHQRAVQLTPNDHAVMAGQQVNLGNSFLRRYEHTRDIVDIREAMSNFRQSGTHKSGPPSIRLIAARRWATLSATHNPTESLQAYGVVVDLLSQVAAMDRTIQQRHASLVDLSSLTATAASAAFAQDDIQRALEWLEQGRCLVWNQLNQLRTPVDDLRVHDESLARRFLDVSNALEVSGSRQQSTSQALDTTFSRQVYLEDEAHLHVRRAREWGDLLDKIRSIPGFHEFLRPPRASNIMQNLPRDGPVIIINVHEDRCDALALIPDHAQPLHIPLNGLTYERTSKLRDRLRRYLSLRNCRMREADRGPRVVLDSSDEETSEIHDILQELWHRVVKPILDALAYSPHPSGPSRLWWCATGPLTFLPLHAAGIYGSDISPGSCVSDYVVSSYTPTVSALLEKVKALKIERPRTSKVLLVSQPHTPGLSPIPGTTQEIGAVREKLGTEACESLCLEGSVATVSQVKQEMGLCGWVHLACHASQATHDPLKSGFFLHDGRLELLDIMKQKIPHCELAFLSACQTSTGDEKLSEEAVHLAAGMLAAGYQGVVATMWSIRDKYAPEVAGAFYEYLLEKGMDKGNARLDSSSAAYALHHAMQCLRKKIGDSEGALLTWVPYVHFGL